MAYVDERGPILNGGRDWRQSSSRTTDVRASALNA
jgi:hypothetical protein